MTLPRACAAIIALSVMASLATRLWLRVHVDGENVAEALWGMYLFYTIWTNTLIGLACAALATGQRVTARTFSNLLLSIIIVAAVYHALLAQMNDFAGIDRLVDTMFHTAIPLGFALFWLAFVPKSGLRFGDIPYWLILPLVYCLYAMTRAQVDGDYPYFFLDLADLGPARTAVNILGLLIAFAGIGALIVLLARVLSRFDRAAQIT